MAFREMLQRAVEDVPGALLCTLMGYDGIAIDTFETEASVEKDITTATIELTGLIGQVRQSTAGLKTGDLSELTVAGKELTALVRPVTGEYFLALVMNASANLGKARYELRVLAPRLVQELS